MTVFAFDNLAISTLASGISSGSTSATLALGDGAKFPLTTGFTLGARITDAATETQDEIVWITNVTGDVLTIARGQEGSTAQAWLTGAIFQHCVTAAALTAFVQANQNIAPVQAHVQGASIGPSYSDTLTIGFTAITAGYVLCSAFLNMNSVASQPVTLTLSNSKDGQVGQDSCTLSQQHQYFVHVNAGDGILVSLVVAGAAGSYPATPGSYAVYASFSASSL